MFNLLKPDWKPNDVIRMFHEEREKFVARGNDCKKLLADTDSVLKEMLALKNLYLYISPKTSQLHSECKTIIQERDDLRESYDKINTALNKQRELRSIFKRMPDIKSQIVSVLESVFQGYQTQRQDGSGAPLDEYYGRFYIECRRIKELTIQLESCLSTTNTDELLLHLEEIYTVYFDIREQLIEPVFTKTLRQLVSSLGRNYCDLLRQTSSTLVRISRNEIQLLNQIFPSPPSALTEEGGEHPIKRQILNRFLDLMCRIFYEHLRPVVIHVNHLETLAELYKLITETIKPEVSEESYQSTMGVLAEDVQERTVFRLEVFIQESVLDYKPSSGDLAYPEILEIVGSGELKDYQSLWYPTVQRSVLALIYLSRIFDPITFREMAKEVVLACLKSLDIAQRLIDERHGGTKIEASLFLSKHLVIIKDQLLSYGIERISFNTQCKANEDPQATSTSKLVEIDTSSLEALMKLFQDNEFSGATNDSLWAQLNETIVSNTRRTFRATKLR